VVGGGYSIYHLTRLFKRIETDNGTHWGALQAGGHGFESRRSRALNCPLTGCTDCWRSYLTVRACFSIVPVGPHGNDGGHSGRLRDLC
jgi:hypothetical protein